ncbi:MAG: hypothetical protein QOJ40_3099, partial [Verrucomicrobiota bacterium]
MTVRQSPPSHITEPKPLILSGQFHFPIQLIENFVRRFRQYRRNQ